MSAGRVILAGTSRRGFANGHEVMVASREAMTGCVGKRAYMTRRAAFDVLGRMRLQGSDESPENPLNVYRCRVCDRWHVGHRPARARIR